MPNSPRSRKKTKSQTPPDAKSYTHPTAQSLLRPDVGTQAQFRKRKPPQRYRYDSSLSPALDWDGQPRGRDLGEWLLALIEKAAALPAPHLFEKPEEFRAADETVVATVTGLRDTVEQLKRLGLPFLNWAGKAERLSFDVPTLPLFVHERLSTRAILETLKGHRRDKGRTQGELFGDPQHPIHEQVLRAYEHKDNWTNRMILGDSLLVMNSLLHYEGLGGQVQMIYMDPPYGVKFGSNFQPFVRKRDVKHNDDGDLTREPEMVKAYRDTWELGLHSYLTYLRDRLLLCRELLAPSGSIFVQIGDENLHHVREVMDEVLGSENFVAVITFRTTANLVANVIGKNSDYLLWYARNRSRVKYRQLFEERTLVDDVGERYTRVELPNGERRFMTAQERQNPNSLPSGARVYRHDNLTSQGATITGTVDFEFDGEAYHPGPNRHWTTTREGLERLAKARRLAAPTPNSLAYVRYMDDFPVAEIANVWTDTQTGAFTDAKIYVVQTNTKVVGRCLLMTTDPGDLVFDPTCGSGTTAIVAEQLGRRWITTDVSRVPLALARQRLLTATFPYYQLNEESNGPAGGFVFVRKQNSRGEEVGGIVPHVTLKSIANDEPPKEEVLVDRPEVTSNITRISGPFCFEATIPSPVEANGEEGTPAIGERPAEYGPFVDRMIEVLRKAPVLHVQGGKTVKLKNVRPPARTLFLTAEASVENGAEKPVAIVFGPENGAISERLVQEAVKEANLKGYAHLYVIGFAIEANARSLVDHTAAMGTVPATYVQATPDLLMGDLLKNLRSSQIFSVCGLPDVKLRKLPPAGKGLPPRFQVELEGLDVFDPVTSELDHRAGNDVPAWFLDTNYNGLSFHVCQAFFPRTAAWDDLKRALRSDFEESVFDHLAGTKSAPFVEEDQGQIAVKVIDDRGNELVVVKPLSQATS